MFKGIGASPGIAIGKVLLLKQENIKVEKKQINNIVDEVNKFNNALKKSKEQLEHIIQETKKNLGEDKSQIFEAHIMVLEDPELVNSTINKIKEDSVNAEYAFENVSNMFISMFESLEDEYMRERADDIKDISIRVLKNLLGIENKDLSNLDDHVILVATDLIPSVTATMDKDKVLGFMTDIGGRTSHTAIMARSIEIPAIVGLKTITNNVEDGDYVILNGETGEVIINPNQEEIDKYEEIKKQYELTKKELSQLVGKPSITTDGKHVEIAGNIGTPDDIKGLLENDAEGVGLFRTEFIYMNRDQLPNEEEQFQAYKQVIEAMDNKPVIIRTLDIGGDKKLSYLEIQDEMNPFLGYRAIRLCLDRKEIFITQLRALLRASVYGNLKIMFPMISSVEELIEAKEILKTVKQDLDKEEIKYKKDIEIGMMIEVPSVAIISDLLAKHVDFFSIGTNDLVQYTTAVDRMNEKISHLYNPFNPAVLRLIKMVIENAHKEGIWVGMCGEIAGDIRMIPILLGMGLDEFSMSAISILKARKMIRSLNQKEMKEIVEKVINIESASEIEKYLESVFMN